MKDFYIAGNSGLAKEILYLTKSVFKSGYNFCGFIDYEPKLKTVLCLGKEYRVFEEDVFINSFDLSEKSQIDIIFGIGNPQKLFGIVPKFSGFNFPNIIHPNFTGDSNSIQLGQGNIITAGCSFTCDITIGSFNLFNLNTTVGHDAVIGDSNIINPGVNISGKVRIGDANLLGTNATILQGLVMGSFSVLGASSLATKDIGNQEVMVGIPAKPIKK